MSTTAPSTEPIWTGVQLKQYQWVCEHIPSIFKNLVPHLHKILLASVHDILWSQAVDHVAGVKYNQKKNHAEEQKSLWASSLRSYFVQLEIKKEKVNDIHLIFSWYYWSKAFAYPYPEEPDAHVANASHRCDYKVHSNYCDQNVIQWKHLR